LNPATHATATGWQWRLQKTRNGGERPKSTSKAIEIDQFKAEYCTGLGALYKEVGMVKRAQSQFNRALQLEPDNQAALEGLHSLPEAGKKKSGLTALKKLFRVKK
jgi:hypothetical protein